GGLDVRSLRQYRAEVVPWLWFLPRTADCRIFQHKSAPQIIEQVFKELGFTDFEFNLRGDHPRRDYCVQYRETDFNFVSRLLEEEGVFYWFRHEDGKHTLVLADHKGAYQDCVAQGVRYSAGSLAENHVTSWEHRYEFRPGKYSQTDYNFETPGLHLGTSADTLVRLPGNGKFEVFDYPGLYMKRGAGATATKTRMEEEELAHGVGTGASTGTTLTPGGKFVLAEHDCPSEAGKGHLLTSIQHSARDASYETGEGEGEEYSNTSTCIPDSVVYRPAR